MTTIKMSMVTSIMLLFVFLFGFVLAIGDIDNIVQLDQGRVLGTVLKSRNGREFKAFFGIPYAKPPIGDLRFKDPVPAGPWDGVLKPSIKAQNVICIQKNLFFYQIADVLLGEEDCLYINVYTPKLPTKQDGKLLPVMVWIAGGGFFALGGSITAFGPQYLLDKDIILVTFNYRLGILGFLSTEDKHLPGNYGMKDQVLALKWVQKNINVFGGDSNRVTIFGESAGSVSVGLHLLSPMSKGLFHKAIMESSTPLNLWGVTPPGLAKRRASNVSTVVGCSEDPEKMVECLRRVPAAVLVDVYTNFYEWRNYPILNFSPVVECRHLCNEHHESFLTKYPPLEFKQESNVPVLIGHTSSEGGIFVSRMYNATDLVYTELKDNFNYYFSSMIQYKYTTKSSDIQFIGDKIFKRYFPDGTLRNVSNAIKATTGGLFLNGVFGMAVKLSQPPYYYVYDHLNKKTYNSLFGPYPEPRKLGVTHADDTISLFYMPAIFGNLDGDDLEVSKLMVNLWTHFASSDKPTINGTKEGQKWPTFDTTSYKYILINSSNPVISERPYVDEYEFWRDLPLFSGISYHKTNDLRCEL
ncbi:Carboxylesterase type B, conserved site,Carboxylesterase, type B,Carboxylesterase type B [Cinara cedri]|uniref:Carboxylic ester hydrolase n=1 Tax=Cinara cedri TaxID=506608 RepID=A0A5E4NJ70_9HEMI|nr:Carboxylesterase type B, conserved site,Carboxylesterase, type B,Carboxylesterase type B [Cinara cedri]